MLTHIRPPLLGVSLALAFAHGCAVEADDADDSLRSLPVAAIAADGTRYAAGTYDPSVSELVFVPTFVEEAAGRPFTIVGADDVAPLASRVSWGTQLDVGSSLELVAGAEDRSFEGATLVIMSHDWSEAQGTQSFRWGGCLPNCCFQGIFCEQK